MKIVLVTGGIRSGKSRFAERMASQIGGSDVTYIATCRPDDHEMHERVERHRMQRPADWSTVECSLDAASAVHAARTSTVLLECITLLVSNVMFEHRESEAGLSVAREVDALIAAALQRDGDLIVVSNEVGSGGIAMSEVGRSFCDALGSANQKIAAAAGEVYWMVSGIPVPVKS